MSPLIDRVRSRRAAPAIEFIAIFPAWILTAMLMLAMYFILINGIMLQHATSQATLQLGAAGCSTTTIEEEYRARVQSAGANLNRAEGTRPYDLQVWDQGSTGSGSWVGIDESDKCEGSAIGSEEEVSQGSFLRLTGTVTYQPVPQVLPAITLQRQTIVLAQSVKTTGEQGQ